MLGVIGVQVNAPYLCS